MCCSAGRTSRCPVSSGRGSSPGTGSIPPLTFDRAVPGELLARLTYRSRRGERQIKHVVDGELRSVVSLQGIYRPAPESAGELEALVTAAVTAAG